VKEVMGSMRDTYRRPKVREMGMEGGCGSLQQVREDGKQSSIEPANDYMNINTS